MATLLGCQTREVKVTDVPLSDKMTLAHLLDPLRRDDGSDWSYFPTEIDPFSRDYPEETEAERGTELVLAPSMGDGWQGFALMTSNGVITAFACGPRFSLESGVWGPSFSAARRTYGDEKYQKIFRNHCRRIMALVFDDDEVRKSIVKLNVRGEDSNWENDMQRAMSTLRDVCLRKLTAGFSTEDGEITIDDIPSALQWARDEVAKAES